MTSLATGLPWWSKLLTKWALTHLPVNYRQWARLGLFRHGAMDDPGYAVGVFRHHLDRARSAAPLPSFVGLEVGPGDSLASAVIARAHGASQYYLLDVGEFASAGMSSYRRLSTHLAELGLAPPSLEQITTVDELLGACRAQYLTRGLDSLRLIPTASVDYVWSHTVLQHIRKHQFGEYLRELRRILRPSGVCSHLMDLTDLMAWNLNHLRFSERLWESHFIARSGYYSNRIRYGEMLSHFRSAGFTLTSIQTTQWPHLPIPRTKLSSPYCDLPEHDLLVSGFEVLLRPA